MGHALETERLEMADNSVYHGDNLDMLKRHVKTETVDLIYLDPPFNSKGSYAYRDPENGTQSQAFEDTWHWDEEAYQEAVEGGGQIVAALIALRDLLGECDLLAYLSMMAPRLSELHRVLKDTGSMFLHCDTTASHYLKVLLDALFDVRNFRNEIVWKRTSAHNDSKVFGKNHDSILYYTKSNNFSANKVYRPYGESYIRSHYRYVDEEGRRFRWGDATASGAGPPRDFFGQEISPPAGTHWRWTQENIDRLIEEGRIGLTSKGTPRSKGFLDERHGVAVQDTWVDISPINSQSKEMAWLSHSET